MTEMELRIQVGPSLTMEREVVMKLTVGHLNKLWEAMDDISNDPEFRECCNVCCSICWALNRLLETLQLDDICRSYKEGWVWWDDENDCVNRDMLAKAWGRIDCHSEE